MTLEQHWLTTASAILGALILLNALVYCLLVRRHVFKTIDALFSVRGFLVVCLLLLLFMASILLNPVPLPSMLGTLTLVALFLATVCYMLTACASATARHRIPIVSTLVLLAVTFAALGLSDNHRVSFQIKDSAPPRLEASFIEWFTQRNDREHFTSKGVPYPVFLVTAEGGGIYAAYNVASFLARMQDECPVFAQHTFGISSVSGGSLGAAVFAALSSEKATNGGWEPCRPPGQDGEFQRLVQRYFRHDFLSPLVAAVLFPDFLQRFLPVAFPPLDRARALESAFEHAWHGVLAAEKGRSPGVRHNPFAEPLEALWTSRKSTPVLFLNTTALSTGARVTISSIFFDVTPTAFHVSQALLNPCPGGPLKSISMALSTAVSLSARFPWVTPVGWLDRPGELPCPERGTYGNRLYLADGGYFENSGLETAIELAARLRRVVELRRDVFPNGAKTVEITIINVLTADSFARRWWSYDADLSSSGHGEITSPIMTLLNTRRARTRAVDSRTVFDRSYYMDGPLAEKHAVRIEDPSFSVMDFIPGYYRVMIDGTGLFLPLGWHMSAQTRRAIDRQKSKLLDASRCLIRNDLAGSGGSEWESGPRLSARPPMIATAAGAARPQGTLLSIRECS